PVLSATTALNVNASAAPNPLSITGNDGANNLTGTAFADILIGGADNDILIGGAGTDAINGGDGSDIHLIASSTDHSAAEFNDTGTSGTDELRFASITAGQTLSVFATDRGLE
ncbi:MAG: hypothetical protein ACK486_04340, partial [Cyanobacteriota bacterium]